MQTRSYQNAPYRMAVEGIIPLMENSIPAGGNKSPEING